ncbi:MAG: hypothetical protein R3213_11290, partial [Flavobacteriaceae bacterium]|nr:hypothetical protein [Flavobacteriaceae bacterium]
MELVDLIEKISTQLENNLPVVAYRKPNENLVNALIQPTDELFEIDDFGAPGFLFSPFVSKFLHVFFPYSEENLFTAYFDSESPFEIDSHKHSIEENVEKESYLKLVSNAVKHIKDSDL